VYGAVGVLLVPHVIGLVRAYREGTEEDYARTAGKTGCENRAMSDEIEYPNCGVRNHGGCQFRGGCVSELSSEGRETRRTFDTFRAANAVCEREQSVAADPQA
jgi:hypothetical protein